jgi:hypothetical protein
VGLVGPRVDPLGEVLIKLLPEGLRALLAPAVALPALVLPPPAAPLMPVVVPLVVDPVAEAPPVEPLLCAKAALLAKASAAANPIVANLIDVSPRLRLQTRDKLPYRYTFLPSRKRWIGISMAPGSVNGVPRRLACHA